MNKIKVSHELPLCLLPYSEHINDYEYILVHLLDKYPSYLEHMLKAKEKGTFIIMDNSAHELKEPYSDEKLFEWVNIIKPNIFIVPDYIEDKTRSSVKAKEWANVILPAGVEKMAVVQATSFADALESYTLYKDLGYKYISFPYGSNYYTELSNHPNKDFAKAIGRNIVVSKLYKLGVISDTDRIHLLGCSIPNEFFLYQNMSFIKSVDTSNPIASAFEGIEYDINGLSVKPKIKIDEIMEMELSKETLKTVLINSFRFRRINNFSPITILHQELLNV